MKTLFQIIAFILISGSIFAQSSEKNFDAIAQYLNEQNSSGLLNYFANTVDMTIELEDGSFSKQQAMVLLKDFFKQNKSTQFKITHKGSSNEKTFYAVGNLRGATKNWSVYILMNKDLKIIQLQIEE